MCPFCLATLGLVVAKTVSAGGLAAALAVKGAKRTTQQKRFQTQMKRSNENVNTHSREPESSFPRRMARGSQKAPGQREQLNHRLPEAALASDPRATAEWDLRAETGEAGGNPQAGRRGTKAWYP